MTASRTLVLRYTGDASGLAKATSQASGAVSGFAKAAQGVTGAIGRIGRGVGNVLGVAAAATGAFGVSAFTAAARVDELDVAMQAVGKSTGVGYDALNKAAKAIKDNGIEMAVAQSMAMKFAQAGLEVGKAADVARVAQDLAVISGKNSTEVTDTLTTAILTGNTQLLRSVGINKQASEAYADYAKQHGKNVTALTAAEKQQAILNLVMSEGVKVAGTYEAAMEAPGKVLRSFPRLFNDISVAAGRPLLDAFGGTIKGAYDLTKAFAHAAEGPFQPYLEALGIALKNVVSPLKNALSTAKGWVSGLKAPVKSVDSMAASIQKWIPLVGSAGAALATFAGKNLLGAIPGMAGFAGALSPVTVGLSALVALSPSLRGVFSNFVGQLKPAVKPIMDLGSSIGNTLLGAIDRLAPAFGKIGSAVAPVITTLVSRLAPAFDKVVSAVAGPQGALDRLTPVFGKIVSAAGPLITSLTNKIVPAFETIVEAVMSTGGPFDAFVSLLDAGAGALRTIEPAVSLVGTVVGKLADGFAKLPGPLKVAVTAFAGLKLTPLGDQVSKLASGITGKLSGAFGSAKGALSNFRYEMDFNKLVAEEAGGKMSGFGAAVRTAGQQVGNAAKGGFAALGAVFSPTTLLVGGLSLALGLLSESQSKAAQAAKDHENAISSFADQLDQTNGIIDDSMLQTWAKQTADEDSLHVLDKLGVSQSEFLQLLKQGGPELEAFGQTLTANNVDMKNLTDEQVKAFYVIADLTDMVLKGNEAFDKGKDAVNDLNASSKKMSPTLADAAESMKTFGDEANDAASRTNALAQALLDLAGGGPSVEEAAIRQASAMRDMKSSFTDSESGAKVMGDAFVGTTTKLNSNAEAAEKVTTYMKTVALPAFADVTRAAFDSAGGFDNLGASMDAGQKAGERARADFIKNAKQMGLTGKQAEALADQYGLVPEDVSTAIALEGARQAGVTLDDLRTKYGDLPERKLLELWAKDNATPVITKVKIDVDSLEGKQVVLDALNKAGVPKEQAQKTVDSLHGKEVTLEALNKAGVGKEQAQKTVDSLHGRQVVLDALNKAGVGKEQAQRVVNSLHGKQVTLDALNKAGVPKDQAQKVINSLQGKDVPITAKDNTGPGVGSANANLNSVKDKKVSINVVANMSAADRALASRFGWGYNAGGPVIAGMQTGGRIYGPGGTDRVPLMGTAGEYVIRRPAARALGDDVLAQINRTGQLPTANVTTLGPELSAKLDQLAEAVATRMPTTLVVVDSDGQLIGRMRVEANRQIGNQARELRLAGR